MRWLDSITDSMDMNLSKLQKIVKDRGAWHTAVHGVTKSWFPGYHAAAAKSLQSCLTLCDPIDFSTAGYPALHYLPEFAQTHVH